MDAARSEYRDYRQESEIRAQEAELQQAKLREAELEARLKALEEAQKKGGEPAAAVAPASQ
jgi:cell division protein FtsB